MVGDRREKPKGEPTGSSREHDAASPIEIPSTLLASLRRQSTIDPRIATDEKYAALALSRLFDLSPSEASEISRLATQTVTARAELVRTLFALGDPDNSASKLLKEARVKIDALGTAVHGIAAHPAFEKLLSKTILREEGIEALNEVEAPIVDNGSMTYQAGHYHVVDCTYIVPQLVNSAPKDASTGRSDPVAHLRRFCENLDELKAHADRTSMYLYYSDVVLAVLLLPEAERLREGGDDEALTRNAVAFFPNPALSTALDATERRVADYKEIAALGLSNLLVVSPLMRDSMIGAIKELPSTLDALDAAGHDARVAHKLILAAGPESAFEVIERFIQYPEICALVKNVSHYRISGKEILEFLLDPETYQTRLPNDESYLEAALRVDRESTSGESSAVLIKNRTTLLADPKIDRVVRMACHRHAGAQLLQAYVNFMSENDIDKAEKVLLLSHDEALDGGTAKKKIHALTSTARSTPRLDSKEKIEKRNWFETLVDEASAKSDHRHHALLVRCYEMLPPSLRDRMRSIYSTDPELLPKFAEQVREFSGNGMYRYLLKNPVFFEAYKEALAADSAPLLAFLRNCPDSEEPESFPTELRKILIPVREVKAPPPGNGTPATPQSREGDRNFSRLIIYGGMLSPESYPKILEALPELGGNVLFMGERVNPDQVRRFGPDDLIIWIKLGSGHSARQRLQGNFDAMEPPQFLMYPHIGSGADPLIDFVRGLMSPEMLRRS